MRQIKSTELDRGLLEIKCILPIGKFEEKEKEIINFLSPDGVYHSPLTGQLYSVLLMGNNLEEAMEMVLVIREIVIGMARIDRDIPITFHDVQNVLCLKADVEERRMIGSGAGTGPPIEERVDAVDLKELLVKTDDLIEMLRGKK